MSSNQMTITTKGWVEIPAEKGDLTIESSKPIFLAWTNTGLPPSGDMRGHFCQGSLVVNIHSTEKLWAYSQKVPCTVVYTEAK